MVNIDEIAKALIEKKGNLKAACDYLKISEAQTRAVLKMEFGGFFKFKQVMYEKIILESIRKENLTIPEVSEDTGLARVTIKKIVMNKNWEHKLIIQKRRKKQNLDLERMALQEGLRPATIARELDMTRENVGSYLRRRKLTKANKLAIENRAKKIPLKRNIVQLIYNLSKFKALNREERCAAKFILFNDVRDLKNHTFNNLRDFYLNYFNNIDEKTSYEDLGKPYDFYGAEAKRLLDRVGLKGLNWEHQKYTEAQKQALENSLQSQLSLNDIGHFTGINSSTVRLYFKKQEKTPQLKRLFNQYSWSYALVSEIYLVQDIHELEGQEYGEKEVLNHFGLSTGSKDNLDTILNDREDIEIKIMQQIQILYPEKIITKPYL